MSGLFLGVDGGASSTTALIADAHGRILGRGSGGPSNHASGPEGRRKFLDAVGSCLRQACEQAGASYDTISFEAVCLGFTGGSEDKTAHAHELIRSEHWRITHDAEIGLAGALAGKPGIMVIAGTGSMAFGRNGAGKTARAGGWGYIFGDEGGALWLVRQALRACLRSEEGWGERTELELLFKEESGAQSMNELLHRFYAVHRSQIAVYAQLVNRAASRGDHVAQNIFCEAGRELAGYANGVRQHLFSATDEFEVSYVGGAFQSASLLSAYRSEVEQQLKRTVIAPRMSPAAGALLEAFRLAPGEVPLAELANQLESFATK